MTQAIDTTIHTAASITIDTVVLPRADWKVEMTTQGLSIGPEKGSWYPHIVRGRARHDVTVVPMIGCPACGKLIMISHTHAVARWIGAMHPRKIRVPVAHAVNHLGKVSPDIQCMHMGCSFHRRVYLDRWNKTKPLYAVAYFDLTKGGELGGEIAIDYCHAIDRREALNQFGLGARRNVRIIDAGPALGFYVKDKEGKRLSAD